MEKPKRIPDIIFRTSKGPFTLVPRKMVYDPNLSLKAKGLIITLLGEPRIYSLSVLRKCSKGGEASIRSVLKELHEKGYLKSTRLSVENITHLDTVLGIRKEKGANNEENQ